MTLGRPAPVGRWLERALDPEGVPRTLPLEEWADGLGLLARGWMERGEGWPEGFDAIAEGWFRALLRFSRPDGSAATGPLASRVEAERGELLQAWARRLSDPGLMTVVDWWFPGAGKIRHAAPPLPADARPDRPLAMLRANWQKEGDLIAVDHRAGGVATAFEFFAHGRTWLGPHWDSVAADGPVTRARLLRWVSHSTADLFEWGFRAGTVRVVRTVVFLRGRQLALLGEQWEGTNNPSPLRWQLAPEMTVEPNPEDSSRLLLPHRGRPIVRVIPIGLPRGPHESEAGRLETDGERLILTPSQRPGRRGWRAVLLSWDPGRNRKSLHWRTLTVTENTRVRGPETAFAARVSWGRDQTLLIYRSLNGPALRAVLGHQTRASFLIGLFNAEGEIEPLLKVEA